MVLHKPPDSAIGLLESKRRLLIIWTYPNAIQLDEQISTARRSAREHRLRRYSANAFTRKSRACPHQPPTIRLMAQLTQAMTDRLLNEFALRSFRDVADGDYIAARMAYRAELLLQAFWASQQALEKYLKGILLFRRIPYIKRTHSLTKLLEKLEPTFALDLSTGARRFITFINEWDVDRYFTFPYLSDGDQLFKLDEAVWEVRRYCIPVDRRISPQGMSVRELDLRYIESARDRPPQLFRTMVSGVIERELNPTSPAYKALTWKNLYFGNTIRKSVRHALKSTAHNSTLFRHPEIIDELKKFIYVPQSAEILKQ